MYRRATRVKVLLGEEEVARLRTSWEKGKCVRNAVRRNVSDVKTLHQSWRGVSCGTKEGAGGGSYLADQLGASYVCGLQVGDENKRDVKREGLGHDRQFTIDGDLLN